MVKNKTEQNVIWTWFIGQIDFKTFFVGHTQTRNTNTYHKMDNDNYSLSTTSSTIIMMTRAFIYVMYIYVSVCLPGGFDLDTFGVFFFVISTYSVDWWVWRNSGCSSILFLEFLVSLVVEFDMIMTDSIFSFFFVLGQS